MAPPVLEIIEGSAAGTTFTVDAAVELGRDQSAGIVVDDAEISRRHARLEPAGGNVLVEDLGSRNGSYLNDQPVLGRMEARPGDRLRFGVTVLAVQGARQASGVLPVPAITQLGAQVLQPAPERELSVAAPDPVGPAFLAAETEPGYVPGGRSGGLAPVGGGLGGAGLNAATPQDAEGGEQYQRVAALRDPRVKPQTRLAAAGFLLIAVLAIIVYFGVTS
jgi:Inner membrane component of T3SS, cytoplasmic domain